MTPELYRELAEHGEDILVERKQQMTEPEDFGAVVASMANMLGGWVLLGVQNKTHELVAFTLKGTDPQSYIGQRLRNAVDPVPPFLAGTLDVDDTPVAFVRVFPASVPVLVRGTGAVHTRDDAGKTPVADHRLLLELARSGRDAEEQARVRPQIALPMEVLALPTKKYPIAEGHMRSIVRAAPLTVTPQLSEWPITRGAASCQEGAERLAGEMNAPHGFDTRVEPFGRAVAAKAAPLEPAPTIFSSYRAVTIADCAGVFGAAASKECANAYEPHELKRQFLEPLIEVVAELLRRAEAYGDAIFDLHLDSSRDIFIKGSGDFRDHPLELPLHCGSAILSIPADEDDRAELAERWEREVARVARVEMWEPPPGE